MLAENSKIFNSNFKTFQEGVQNFTTYAVQKRKKNFFICTLKCKTVKF